MDADQVLEAQRRFLDAYLTYVRVTAELAPDPAVREARLRLLKRLEAQIVKLADISEIVAEETRSG